MPLFIMRNIYPEFPGPHPHILTQVGGQNPNPTHFSLEMGASHLILSNPYLGLLGWALCKTQIQGQMMSPPKLVGLCVRGFGSGPPLYFMAVFYENVRYYFHSMTVSLGTKNHGVSFFLYSNSVAPSTSPLPSPLSITLTQLLPLPLLMSGACLALSAQLHTTWGYFSPTVIFSYLVTLF